jgi:hypothetical protein
METIDTDFHILDKIQEANDPSDFFNKISFPTNWWWEDRYYI